jgi:hypothetical protein
MILRIVLGRLPSGTDAAALVELRGQLARAARDVPGLDSLIVGARLALLSGEHGEVPVEAAIITVWRDAESMARATGIDEQSRRCHPRRVRTCASSRSERGPTTRRASSKRCVIGTRGS